MSTYRDDEVERLLKNWTAAYQPLADGRARLLDQATMVQRKKQDHAYLISKPQFDAYLFHNSNEWSQTLYTWFFAQSIHAGIHACA